MERSEIFQATIARFLEPVRAYLDDPSVSEIMINGPFEIYVERAGQVTRTDAAFADEGALESAARNIAQFTNKRITPDTSRFDSRLPDGSRVHVVLPRCSQKGLCIAIRRFSKKSFSLEGLVERGAFTDQVREYIELVVAIEKNLVVSGGTGTGKTSLLNAISGKIDSTERIIVIEDSSELQLQQPHVLPFETRMPDRHGRGAVTIRDLFHSALRMRPDRIVIGECRGGEALDLIQAMTSGHGGSMSTLHANTASDALHRLETMALMSGIEIPLTALRAQVASAIDVVVQLTRLGDGRRVLLEVSEVGRLTTDFRYDVTQIFTYDGDRRCTTWTGARSAFGDEVRQKGLAGHVDLTRPVFGLEGQ
ncbi:MAG: CpaF family protein [Acidobacteria bacterium]|nr:CpaF family protein [Acidobacteriota bacterium]